eukprot:scaffold663595_cov34-Prasinocladus_malaysianus.AAC.1
MAVTGFYSRPQEPGVYRLEYGNLEKMPSIEPFMVVSDLDGTMVGDDSRTARFKVSSNNPNVSSPTHATSHAKSCSHNCKEKLAIACCPMPMQSFGRRVAQVDYHCIIFFPAMARCLLL